MLLPTTKTRITTNLKTINNQKCQKIKLQGTLTTKELKKHSSRPVGGEEMDSGERTHSKVANCVGQVWLADQETKDAKPLTAKYCGGCEGRRNPQFHRRVHWKVVLQWSKRTALFPLLPLPHRLHHNAAERVVPPWRIPRLRPLTT